MIIVRYSKKLIKIYNFPSVFLILKTMRMMLFQSHAVEIKKETFICNLSFSFHFSSKRKVSYFLVLLFWLRNKINQLQKHWQFLSITSQGPIVLNGSEILRVGKAKWDMEKEKQPDKQVYNILSSKVFHHFSLFCAYKPALFLNLFVQWKECRCMLK